jgi:hypothetical protein
MIIKDAEAGIISKVLKERQLVVAGTGAGVTLTSS